MLERSKICSNTDEFLQTRVVTFLNPYSFMRIWESRLSLEKFDKICIDGIALKVFLELVLFKGPKIQRISFDFTSIANLVFENAVADDERGFILGSDADSNGIFLSKIRSMFPGVTLSGRSGYFDSESVQATFIESLAASDNDFVVIGMGAVKQEKVAIALLDAGYPGKIYTCGGFIHQTALGGGQFYPAWVNRFNLRFAYRMFKEPSTVRRYLIDYPKAFFVFTLNIKKFKY